MIENAAKYHDQDNVLKSSVGYEFRPTDMVWKLERDTSVNLRPIKPLINSGVFEGYIKTLSFFAETRSPRTVLLLNLSYLRLLKFAGGRELDCALMISFREDPSVRDEHLGLLRILFNEWSKLKHYGVEPKVVDLLKQWTFKGSIKGDAVKRLDPDSGPLSDIELQGLLETVVQSYEAGNIDINHASMLLLLQASGRRPLQLANMKLKDLIDVTVDKELSRFFVSVPRIKQRGGGFRQTFRKVEVTQELWDLLLLQKAYVVARFSTLLGLSLPDEIVGELPLYFNEARLLEVTSLQVLADLGATDRLHMVRQEVGATVARAVEASRVISERTGRRLKVTPTRFRYTLGTRAAREGYGVLVIAELLDHSDIQSADVYTVNVPEHAAYIDNIIGNQLAPYAKAFAGVIVDDKKLARRGHEPGSDVRDFSGRGAGTCGHGGVCGAGVPIPCYTCIHFQAWLDGPHELVYTELIRDREEVMKLTRDAAVAAANDRTIIAVAEVVQACKARKEQLKKS